MAKIIFKCPLLLRSAQQGNSGRKLGKMLLYGKEIEQDVTRGLALLDTSAKQGNVYANKVVGNFYSYQGAAKTNAALGSLWLLGRLSQLIKNRLDEEARRDGSIGLIDKKLHREIELKRKAHGLRMS